MPTKKPKPLNPIVHNTLAMIDMSGMTQDEVCKAAGVYPQVIYNMRNGACPSVEVLNKILYVFHCRLEITGML